ncbi:uncharacterized protein B0T23DRAFT_204714 [Neurospora hispaniola]|uniref:Transcription factor domain-containing protein n=1 Tax=Neurospora hispaniola TaxID=588809 RepID=A0AAJ0MPT1_9PEZI|nr:hypothetical protein B0T23DRAFT_204714 [Neurospora hispaniola]
MSAIRLAAATTFTATTNVSESTLLSQVYQFVNHVSGMVMLRGESTLEMLMTAVMVLGRWRWWCEQHRGGFDSLLGIAEGLVQDLGLNRNPRQTQDKEERLTDIEKRLLLGVWYLRSCAATHLSHLTPTVFTPYMLQCLKDLEMSSQPSDQVLVQAVKVQHLEERIRRLNGFTQFRPNRRRSKYRKNYRFEERLGVVEPELSRADAQSTGSLPPQNDLPPPPQVSSRADFQHAFRSIEAGPNSYL